MQRQPFRDKPERSRWKATRHHAIVNPNHDLMLSVYRMKMWRVMIPIQERDGDAEKAGNDWHVRNLLTSTPVDFTKTPVIVSA